MILRQTNNEHAIAMVSVVPSSFRTFGYLRRRKFMVWRLLSKCLLISTACSLLFVPSSKAMENASDYATSENRRVLEDIIEQAQEALRSLDNPDLATDQRAKRNRRERGQPRIVNGRGTKDYPAVGALLKGETGVYCSGTLIAPDRFLTAAHCVVNDPVPNHYKVFFQSAGIFGVKKVDWQKEEYSFPKGDVAVLVLTDPVQRIAPESILVSEEPLAGSLGTIVGFGRTGGFNEDYGIKREGFIETATCPASQRDMPLLCWNFNAEVQAGAIRSNTCNADSGGPLFLYETIAGHQVRYVGGVTSGGEAEDCLLGDQSYDADVLHYKKWILNTAGLPDPPPEVHGAAFVDPDRDVSAETTKLTDDRKEVAFPLEVREGLQSLMVAMNGDDNGRGRNKFVISVSRIDSVIEQQMCSADAPKQFSFCSISDPTPGSWKVTVKQTNGSRAVVQVVVTQLPKTAVQ
jgi:hypothetical protein